MKVRRAVKPKSTCPHAGAVPAAPTKKKSGEAFHPSFTMDGSVVMVVDDILGDGVSVFEDLPVIIG